MEMAIYHQKPRMNYHSAIHLLLIWSEFFPTLYYFYFFQRDVSLKEENVGLIVLDSSQFFGMYCTRYLYWAIINHVHCVHIMKPCNYTKLN